MEFVFNYRKGKKEAEASERQSGLSQRQQCRKQDWEEVGNPLSPTGSGKNKATGNANWNKIPKHSYWGRRHTLKSWNIGSKRESG